MQIINSKPIKLAENDKIDQNLPQSTQMTKISKFSKTQFC